MEEQSKESAMEAQQKQVKRGCGCGARRGANQRVGRRTTVPTNQALTGNTPVNPVNTNESTPIENIPVENTQVIEATTDTSSVEEAVSFKTFKATARRITRGNI